MISRMDVLPRTTFGLLVADHRALFREVLRAVLAGEPDVSNVDLAEDGVQAFDAIVLKQPTVALVNADIPSLDTPTILRALKEASRPGRLIFVLNQDEPDFLADGLRMGARGAISKDTPLSQVMDVVRRVARGEIVIPDDGFTDVVDCILTASTKRDVALRLLGRLTPRERTILALLSEGGGNASVASALFISPLTARTHIQKVMFKLGVHSRLEAAMFVSQNHLLYELKMQGA